MYGFMCLPLCFPIFPCPGAVAEWLRLRTEGHMPPLHGSETRYGLMPANLCFTIEMRCDVPSSVNNVKFNCTSSTNKDILLYMPY